jgi:hypothetical protein
MDIREGMRVILKDKVELESAYDEQGDYFYLPVARLRSSSIIDHIQDQMQENPSMRNTMLIIELEG